MPIRNRHRPGTHLTRDEETDFVHYSDEMVTRWDGLIVHYKNTESRHPQDFVRVIAENKRIYPISPEPLAVFTTAEQSPFIGNTGIFTPVVPASHLHGWSGQENIQQGVGFSIIESPNPYLVFEVG